MKQEDLRAARLIEAKRRWIENETPRREVEHLADLYETNWTPIDPDVLAARAYIMTHVLPNERRRVAEGAYDGHANAVSFIAGIKHGRQSRSEIVWPTWDGGQGNYLAGWNAAICACRKALERTNP